MHVPAYSRMCILDSDYRFIRQLNTSNLFHRTDVGGRQLRKTITFKERKELEDKMANVFQENIKGLSAELQRILLDDLVTAFQSRINVLTRVQKKASY
jgi:hypothetical protein